MALSEAHTAASCAGRLIDRHGGAQLLVVTALCYMVAVIGFIVVHVGANSVGELVALRLVQGLGVAAALPAALSLVPKLAPFPRHVGTALVATAHNVTLALLPFLSLYLVTRGSLASVGVLALSCVVMGLALGARLFRQVWRMESSAKETRRGLHVRREWLGTLTAQMLNSVGWGFLMAFLAQHADARHSNVAVFYFADAFAIVSLRFPTGWLLGKRRPRGLTVLGVLLAAGAMSLLSLPINSQLLAIAGVIFVAGRHSRSRLC